MLARVPGDESNPAKINIIRNDTKRYQAL